MQDWAEADLCKPLSEFPFTNHSRGIKDVTEKRSTCINLIMVSDQSRVFSSGDTSVGFSDHNLVFKAIKTRKIRAKMKVTKTRNFCKLDIYLFNQGLIM